MAKINYHVTEKSQKAAEAKKAFEKEYGKKVASIQVMNVRKKTSRGGKYTRRPNLKKFTVSFENKAKIEINETENGN